MFKNSFLLLNVRNEPVNHHFQNQSSLNIWPQQSWHPYLCNKSQQEPVKTGLELWSSHPDQDQAAEIIMDLVWIRAESFMWNHQSDKKRLNWFLHFLSALTSPLVSHYSFISYSLIKNKQHAALNQRSLFSVCSRGSECRDQRIEKLTKFHGKSSFNFDQNRVRCLSSSPHETEFNQKLNQTLIQSLNQTEQGVSDSKCFLFYALLWQQFSTNFPKIVSVI